jgi:hypothetical protein
MKEIIMALIVLKTKLDHGTSNMLAMMIGMAKANKLRPPDTCSGVSVNAKRTVKKTRKIVAATRPDHKILIKYMTSIPITVTMLPMINAFTLSQLSTLRKIAARDAVRATRDIAPIPPIEY